MLMTSKPTPAMDSERIALQSSDGKLFEVDRAVAMESLILKKLVAGESFPGAIYIPQVTAKTLTMVLKYNEKHVEMRVNGETVDGELSAWDDDFVNVDPAMLFDLVSAANDLDIEGLLHLASQRIADMVKGKTVEEIRATFKIKNDFTPEEEEKVRKETPWAFEASPGPG